MSQAPDPEPATQGTPTGGHTELKVAAAALAAAASTPLGIAVAAGAALSSPNVRSVLRRATVRAVAGAIQAGDQLNAAVTRRAAASEPTVEPSPQQSSPPEA